MLILYPNGLRKALTFSYDDGVETDYDLVKIFDEFNMPATFNLNSGCFAPEGTVYPPEATYRRMTTSAVKKLFEGSRHEVSAHCLTHASLAGLPTPRVIHEAIADRENLERLFGKIVRGMAYPYGTFDDAAVEALRSCGVAYSRTVHSTHNFEIPSEWLLLHPTCHHDDPMLMELGDRFLAETAPFGIKLFYVWGHSYEFLQKNNWHVIRDFCQKMSGKDDIWYATNIEIVDYINASRKLISSADGKIIYNPTSTDIWADFNSQIITIHAGETIHL